MIYWDEQTSPVQMSLLTFSEVKLQEIYQFLANGQNSDNITLDDVVLTNWGMVDTPFKAYYGSVSVSAIGEWYNQYGNRLFAKKYRHRRSPARTWPRILQPAK